MTHPNVLVLMCDQLRYDALAAHGNPYVSTPNLDRLAAHSVRFTQAFCSSPLCGPTRHSLATGQYPYRHGVVNNVQLPRDNLYTIAHHAREHDIRTGCVGHMHWQRLPGTTGDVFTDHGYETYDAIHPDNSHLSAAEIKRQQWEHAGLTSQSTAGPSIVAEQHSYSRQIADATIARLHQWANSGERFLLWSSFNDPHPPFFPPADRYARYAAMDLPPPRIRPESASPSQAETSTHAAWSRMTPLDHRVMKAGYYGLVELADCHIGRILDTLDELDLWQDTVVLFVADHGEMLGDFGRYFKSVMWEPAVHIPFFIARPGATPGACPALAEHVDVFPTLCRLLGMTPPTGLHGRDLSPWTLPDPPAPDSWRRQVLAQLNMEFMIRSEQWKLIMREEEPVYLFDLENDPDEFYNCRDSQPEVIASLIAAVETEHESCWAETREALASGRVRRPKRKPIITLAETP